MSATLDFTDSQLFTAVRAFLLDVLPAGVEVVRGQVNRVPQVAAPDFVVITAIQRPRLMTNVESWADPINPVALNHMQASDVVLQLDVHGPNSTDNAQLVTTTWRTPYACDFFAALGVPAAPLHADDPLQIPFINGESQYEDRWIVQAHVQTNVTVVTGQQFANTLDAGLISVDATYPP